MSLSSRADRGPPSARCAGCGRPSARPGPARPVHAGLRVAIACALLVCSVVATSSAAQTAPTAQPASIGRPRIGLVLSGGGARGLSHIGVLKVLEQMHVPVDFIASTSMGSIVGGLYASGIDAGALEKEVGTVNWSSMFSDSPARQDLSLRRKEYDAHYSIPFQLGFRDGEFQVFKGAIAGANLELWLHSMTLRDDTLGSFDDLPIPFRAVATDMVTGRQVVFRTGSLYQAIRASMSVPGLFAPLELDGHVYGDGGLVNNLPVDVVQAMGADIVIAVNIGTPLMSRTQLSSIVGLTSQTINILTEQNVREQLARLGPQDVLVQPDLGELTFLDFQKAPQFIALGEKSASAAAVRLRPLALDPAAWAQYQASRHRVTPPTGGNIEFVEIEGTKVVNPESLKRELSSLVGKPFDDARTSDDLARLYGSGDFDRIGYRVVDLHNQRGIQFDVSENSIGPTYLRMGLGFSSDLQGDSSFGLIAGYKRRWLNAWGAELTADAELGTTRRFSTEIYQPLGVASPWFVSAYGQVAREPRYLYDGNRQVAQYSLLREPVGADFGYAASRYGEMRLGFRHTHYRADPQVGSEQFVSGTLDEDGVSLLARYDRLDDPFFPREGTRATLEIFNGNQRFQGAPSSNVTRARVEFLQAFPLTESSQFHVAGRFAWLSENDVGIADDYQLGGFLNLSGLRLNQLSGDHLGFVRAVYAQKLGTLSLVGRAIYAGGSVEAGNIWDRRSDIAWNTARTAGSLFLGLDTYLGPLYFAYGRASGGQSSWYLYLGRP